MCSDFYCHEVLSGCTPVRKVLETENVLAFQHTCPYSQDPHSSNLTSAR